MQQRSQTYAKALPWLMLIFVALYFFELANFPLSIDEETAAFRTDPSVWISQGRWGAYLVELLILPRSSIPVVPPALFGLGCGLAYILILDSSRIRRPLDVVDYFTFAIFCAYPTWFFIAEFYSNLTGTGIALLMSALSVWLVTRERAGAAGVYGFLAAILTAALAIGIYQSFLFMVLAMLFGVVLLRLINGLTTNAWRDAGFGIACIAGAAIVYAVLDKVFRSASPERSPYFDSLWHLDLLISSPLLVIGRSLGRIGNAYGVWATDFGAPLWAATIVVALGLVALAMQSRERTAANRLFLVAAPVVVALAPFALQIVAAGSLPYRAFVGVPFAVWMFATLAIGYSKPLIRNISVVAALLLVFQILVIANLYQATQYFSSRKDLLLAGEITDHIFSLPNYDPSKTYYLALYGNLPFHTTAYPQPQTSTIGHSFFEWDGGSPGRISLFLRLFDYPALRPATPEMETKVIQTLAQMPVFPARGSVAISGDIVLLRLAETAQWANTQAMERAKAQ